MQFACFQQLLHQYLSEKGLNPYRTALDNGLPERAIKSVLEGTKPNFERISEICKALDLQFSITPREQTNSKNDMTHLLPNNRLEGLKLSEDSSLHWNDETTEISFLGDIATGAPGNENDEYICSLESTQTIRLQIGLSPATVKQHGGLCAAKVQGDSMFPTFKNGDIIMFYRNDPDGYHPENLIGKKCAIVLHDNDKIILKRLRRPDSGHADEWNLESISAQWPTQSNVHIRYISPIRLIEVKV